MAVVWIAVLGLTAAALAGHGVAEGEALHALHRGDVGVIRAPGAVVGIALSPLPAGGELVAIVVVGFVALGAIAYFAGRAAGWPVALLVIGFRPLLETAAHGNPNLVWIAVLMAFLPRRKPRRIAPLLILLLALAPFEAIGIGDLRPLLRDDARSRHDLRAALDETPVCKPVGGDADDVQLLAVLYGHALAGPPRGLGTFVTNSHPQHPPTGYGLAAQHGTWRVYKRCAPAVIQQGGE